MVREKMLGIIMTLFAVCFIAIIIEEVFLGGRRRRRAQKAYQKQREINGKE